jgi:hypothetical protein
MAYPGGLLNGHGFNALHNPLAGICRIYDRIYFQIRSHIDGLAALV